jgi:hypothetical protein
MTSGVDMVTPSAGVTAWPTPILCDRCGQAGGRGPGSRWGLCRDCRQTMSRTEQEAWR